MCVCFCSWKISFASIKWTKSNESRQKTTIFYSPSLTLCVCMQFSQWHKSKLRKKYKMCATVKGKCFASARPLDVITTTFIMHSNFVHLHRTLVMFKLTSTAHTYSAVHSVDVAGFIHSSDIATFKLFAHITMRHRMLCKCKPATRHRINTLFNAMHFIQFSKW